MMLMNLFSVFDPTSYLNLSLNWMIFIIILVMFYLKYYFYNNEFMSVQWSMFKMFNNLFKEIADSKYLGISVYCVILLMYLMMSNLIGLFPYIFTWSSHPMMTMSLGLMMWMSFFLMGFMKNFKNSMAHLVPEGSPLLLSPVLVIIECISHLMRPFTLSIRLAANMMAGHLIIGLLSSISLMSFMGLSMSIFMQSLLLLLEMGVSLIQGFVFSILMLLYSLEYY